MTKSAINELTAKEWLYRSKSVISKSFSIHEDAWRIRSLNKACKPPQLCKSIVETFSLKDDIVFDPFAGTGGVVLGTQLAGRKVLGCEINADYIRAYRLACVEMAGLFGSFDAEAIKHAYFGKKPSIQDSNLEALGPLVDGSIGMVFTDPPYFDMDSRPKSKRWWKDKGSQARPMEQFGSGLHYKSIDDWESCMASFASGSFLAARNRAYAVCFMEDMYIEGKYVFLTHRLASVMESVGWIPQGEYIWHNEARRPGFFGYPSRMITNRTHTSILFFRKE